MESAAKWNPNRDIFVLFTAKVGYETNEPPSTIIRALKSYPNVYFRNVNWYNFAIGTPAEHWIKKNIIFESKFFLAHLSDLIRLLSLYKFGGLYFDLDFVFKKNLDFLPSNFAGAESNDVINNAALGFEANGVGHKIIETILR